MPDTAKAFPSFIVRKKRDSVLPAPFRANSVGLTVPSRVSEEPRICLEYLSLLDLVEEVRGSLVHCYPLRRFLWRIGFLPEVVADRRLLHLAMRCLLEKAVTSTAHRTEAVIEIEMIRRNGEEPAIRVQDNGIGFSAPEWREGSSAALGLEVRVAIVRQVVRRHGGRLWIEANRENKQGGGPAQSLISRDLVNREGGASLYFTLGEGGIFRWMRPGAAVAVGASASLPRQKKPENEVESPTHSFPFLPVAL